MTRCGVSCILGCRDILTFFGGGIVASLMWKTMWKSDFWLGIYWAKWVWKSFVVGDEPKNMAIIRAMWGINRQYWGFLSQCVGELALKIQAVSRY